MPPKSGGSDSRGVGVELSAFLSEEHTDLEFGLWISKIDVELDDPRLIAVATGSLVFERRGRGLVMMVDSCEVPNPPSGLNVRHSFRAVLRDDDTGIVLDSLELGPPPVTHVKEGWDEPDRGLSPAALRAIRPAAIVDKVLDGIRKDSWYLRRLGELNKDRWATELVQGERLAEIVARIDEAPSTRPRRRGKERLSADEHYERVAALCADEWNKGQRRGFHRLVQERFGVPKKTAEYWIYEARRDHWLEPSTPGQTRFGPGPRLIDAAARNAPPRNKPLRDLERIEGRATPRRIV